MDPRPRASVPGIGARKSKLQASKPYWPETRIIGASIVTNIVLGVPSYIYSIISPKTLF